MIIREPPADPVAMMSWPFSSSTRLDAMLDWGLFPGRMKLIGLAAKPKALVEPGELKSSISLLRTMPSAVTGLDQQGKFASNNSRGRVLTNSRTPKEVDSGGQADSHSVTVHSS